jgi:hypothetical protein
VVSAAATSVLSALVVATIAFATIPDASNVIHACYGSQGGLRVIDSPAATCKVNETALAWARSGLTGYELVTETNFITPNTSGVVNAHCSSGNSLLGGGFHTPGADMQIIQSFPQTFGGQQSWQALAHSGPGGGNLTAYAICATLIP